MYIIIIIIISFFEDCSSNRGGETGRRVGGKRSFAGEQRMHVRRQKEKRGGEAEGLYDPISTVHARRSGLSQF